MTAKEPTEKNKGDGSLRNSTSETEQKKSQLKACLTLVLTVVFGILLSSYFLQDPDASTKRGRNNTTTNYEHVPTSGDIKPLARYREASPEGNDDTDDNCRSAMNDAVRAGNLDTLQFLVHAGCDSNVRVGIDLAHDLLGADHAVTKYLLIADGAPEMDVGVEQEMKRNDPSLVNDFQKRLDNERDYLQSVAKDLELSPLLPRCKNLHEHCTYWAVKGGCNYFEKDMLQMCNPACFSCDKLLYKYRCPQDTNARNAWEPGDLNIFFEKLTTVEEYKQYEPRIWSRPSYLEGDTEEKADYQLGPWIVSLDNVLSPEEAARLIELGGIEGYERSDDWGEYLDDGTYETYFHDGRTSHHAWCSDCAEDPLGQGVLARITNITNVPADNYEHLQLLRYEEGQFYHTHHDYDDVGLSRQPGVRIMTYFIYLNNVEEGGGTNFPALNLTFTPKLGRVLIWPNVLNDQPDMYDERTKHQALPVIKGVKYAANAWIHQRDFQGPMARDCAE